MSAGKAPGESLGPIEVKDCLGRLVVVQRREHHLVPNTRYAISMTVDEARAVVSNLNKRIALADELQRTGLS